MSVSESVPSTTRAAQSIVAAARKAAVACARPDLVQRLDDVGGRLARPESSAVVMGEFKQGKSSLINALLNAPICPVDDDVATTVLTVVHNAAKPQAIAFVEDPDDPAETKTARLDIDQVVSVVLSGRMPDQTTLVRTVEFGLPRQLLAQGLRLVDTPGVGGIESAHGKATLSVLPLADAVLFVTDASQELTASELDAIRSAYQRCDNVVCVVSKTDLYPHWREAAERNAAHLAAIGLSVPVVALSSMLRSLSIARDDRKLHEESGYATLVAFLHDRVIRDAEQRRVEAAMREVDSAASQLRHTLMAEHQALSSPERAQQLLDAAVAARENVAKLRTETTRWNTVLNDGIRDLTANVEHDLRLRMRALTTDIEAFLDENDPTDIADEFFPLVEERIMAEISNNHDLIRTETIELAHMVDEVFAADMASLFTSKVPGAAMLDDVGSLAVSLDRRPGSVASVLTAMRGSYGGMVMFGGLLGVLGNVVSVATFGPLGLAAGSVLGRKAAKDERSRQLTVRRQQAKQGVKKHIDSVNLRASKHGRDTIRSVHRELRDTTLARAQELSATATETARATARALETDGPASTARLETIGRMVEGLDQILAASARMGRP